MAGKKKRVMPKYPVYVNTKGRAHNALTPKVLLEDGVPFRLVVEPAEVDLYAKRFPEAEQLVLPEDDIGLVACRNWIFEHSISEGAERHWQIDDNISGFWRLWRGERLYCRAGVNLRVTEDFVDRYENVAIAGLNYVMFGVAGSMPPFYLNHHVYSCTLIMNSLPNRFRGKYNEDVDMCLQVLSDGWCTVLMNAFLVQKLATMVLDGGQTTELYQGDGRLKMARALERVWPGVVRTERRFSRPQHVVHSQWRRFDTKLKRKPGLRISKKPNEYGMELVQVKEEIRSPDLKKLVGDRVVKKGKAESKKAEPKVDRSLGGFLALLKGAEPTIDLGRIEGWIEETLEFQRQKQAEREASREGRELEARWYESLERGEPDYSVYADDFYMAELFVCWEVYSKEWIRLLMRLSKKFPKGIVSELGEIRRVVDLGCGMGFTTSLFSELFPKAEVYGTNLKGTTQWKMAQRIGRKAGFKMVGGIKGVKGQADMVFASEYFEHIEDPIEHLTEILSYRPGSLVVVNSFNTTSIGHFPMYKLNGSTVAPRSISRAFSKELRSQGYEAITTGPWNKRPAVWRRLEASG